MGFWDIFYNVSAPVQVAMLLTVFGMVAVPVYALIVWVRTRHLNSLPPDTVFAISRDGDLLHLTINRDAPLARDHLSALWLELAVEKNGPSDIR
jgi:hypothetical protein